MSVLRVVNCCKPMFAGASVVLLMAALFLANGVNPALAATPTIISASRPADLKVTFTRYDQSANEARLNVANTGDVSAPVTTLQVQTLAPGANSGTPTAVSVPALKASETFEYRYRLGQACAPGIRLKAEDALNGDPTPDDNTLEMYPCQPDLQLTFTGQASSQDLQFRVTNIGGMAAKATTAHFDTETTPPSDTSDLKVPALAPGESKMLDYLLAAPCSGVAVKGQVPLEADADLSDNTLQLFACDADLAINFQGFVANSDRDIVFVVSNVGGSASPATTAQVATVLPAPPSNARTVPVPALEQGASFRFVYTLAAPCDGNDVSASVSLDSDPNPVNNATQVTACDKLAPGLKFKPGKTSAVEVPIPPAPIPFSEKPADLSRVTAIADAVATPEDLRPGEHEMDFTPTIVGEALDSRYVEGLFTCFSGEEEADPGWYLVGWYQRPNCWTRVSETAVRFDITELMQGGPKIVTSAHVTFDEQRFEWTDGDGNNRDVAGCVAALGLASSDFALTLASADSVPSSFPNDTYADVTPSATRDFDVTVPVAGWFAPSSWRFGFVLKGSIDHVDDLHGDDQSSCRSKVGNLVLHVSYTVL